MAVTRVVVAPGHWLAPGPAAALAAALAAGMPLDITDAGRTREKQMELWKKQGHLGLASHPDSPLAFHVKGEAVDLGMRATVWLLKHPEYGFRRTVKKEWWHFQWFAALASYKGNDMELNDALGKNPQTKKPSTVGEKIDISGNYSFYTWKLVLELRDVVNQIAEATDTPIDYARISRTVEDAIAKGIDVDVTVTQR